MTVWPTDGGGWQHQSIYYPRVEFIFLFFESERNPVEVIFSSAAPVDRPDHPLWHVALLWRPLVCLHPVLISPPLLQEPPCPAPIFPYMPNLSRTLCSSQPGLFPPLALCLFPVPTCAFSPAHVHPCSVHLFHGLLPSSSSPQWLHSAPNPWNMSRLLCTFFFWNIPPIYLSL